MSGVTLSDLLGAEAAPVTFEHAGKTYSVTPVTQEVKTRVERMLRGKAYADLYADRDLMPGEQYEETLVALQRDRVRYAYLGVEFWKALRGGDQGPLVAVLLQTTPESAAVLLRERGVEVTALVMETLISSMPREQAELVRGKLREKAADPPLPA